MWQGAYHPTVYWPGAYFGRTGGSAGAVYHEAVTLAAATGLSWASVALCATNAAYAAHPDFNGAATATATAPLALMAGSALHHEVMATAAVAWALAASASLAMLGTTPSLYTYAVVRCAAEMLVASLARDHIVGVAVASSERLDPIDAEE